MSQKKERKREINYEEFLENKSPDPLIVTDNNWVYRCKAFQSIFSLQFIVVLSGFYAI